MIVLYLFAIVAANLSVSHFGPDAAIFNAFILIALDLTARDILHDRWKHQNLKRNMAGLILCGSVLSAALNINAAQIAVASFLAFSSAAVFDTYIYGVLADRTRLARMNGSNIGSSIVDSLVFPLVAFGFPFLWKVAIGMIVAKIAGGFVWSMILDAVITESPAYSPK